MDQEFNDIWQLRIYDCHQGCKHVAVVGCSCLCFHNCPCEKTFSTEQVLAKEFDDDVLYVCDIDFVHDAVDAFSQYLPLIFLMLRCGLFLTFQVFQNLA